MGKNGSVLWTSCLCALILFALFSNPKGFVHHGMTSELMGFNEFPITCDPFEGGFFPQPIAAIGLDKGYANNSVFITAAGLNMSSNDPVHWADDYYGNPSNYGYGNYDGTVDARDLFGNWGAQTFSPMAPIMPEFCLIGQSMDNEARALLLESGGGLSAICTLILLPDSTSTDPNHHPTSHCEYTTIEPGNPFWYPGEMHLTTTDEFMYKVQSCNLYLVDSN